MTTTAIEYRQRDYHNSEASPTAELRDGGEIRAYTYANYVVSPMLLWTGNAYIQYDSARVGYLAYTEAGFSAGPSIAFDAPVGEGNPWIFSPNAGLVYRSYDSPDPIVSLTEEEHDLELFIGADLTIPCKANWALLAETEYRHVDSNYSTRDYDNLSISLSVVKSF